MAFQFKTGKYTAKIAAPPEIRVAVKKEGGVPVIDPETGQQATYHYMHIEFQPIAYQGYDDKQSEPVEVNYTREYRRVLGGGNMEGRGKEITEEKALAALGQVFADVGWEAFYAPHNASVVGREFPVICSRKEGDKYDNWEPFTGGSGSQRTPDPAADKSFAKRLNILFGREAKTTTPLAAPATNKFTKPKFD